LFYFVNFFFKKKILNNSHTNRFKDAKKRNIPIVNSDWLENCWKTSSLKLILFFIK